MCSSYTLDHTKEEGHEGDINWHCAANLVAGSLRFETFKTEKQPQPPDLQVSDRFRQISSKCLHLAPGELEVFTASTLKDPIKIRSTSRIEVILYLLVYLFSFQSTQACNMFELCYLAVYVLGETTLLADITNKFLSCRKVNKRWREVLSPLLNSIPAGPSWFLTHSSLCRDSQYKRNRNKCESIEWVCVNSVRVDIMSVWVCDSRYNEWNNPCSNRARGYININVLHVVFSSQLERFPW